MPTLTLPPGNLVEDTLQSPGALTGRRVPLYERSGEGERAPASGLVALAQSDGDPPEGDPGEDAGPARPDGDES
eukprot:COSAG06_NODE_1174_length_10412_cov_15.779405_8_plen_74_part_00